MTVRAADRRRARAGAQARSGPAARPRSVPAAVHLVGEFHPLHDRRAGGDIDLDGAHVRRRCRPAARRHRARATSSAGVLPRDFPPRAHGESDRRGLDRDGTRRGSRSRHPALVTEHCRDRNTGAQQDHGQPLGCDGDPHRAAASSGAPGDVATATDLLGLTSDPNASRPTAGGILDAMRGSPAFEEMRPGCSQGQNRGTFTIATGRFLLTGRRRTIASRGGVGRSGPGDATLRRASAS